TRTRTAVNAASDQVPATWTHRSRVRAGMVEWKRLPGTWHPGAQPCQILMVGTGGCRITVSPIDVTIEQAIGATPNHKGGHMRVMVIVKATKESEAESSPLEMEGAQEMFEQMGKYNEELVKAGIMLAGDGLKPSRFGKRVHFDGAKRTVTDGP